MRTATTENSQEHVTQVLEAVSSDLHACFELQQHNYNSLARWKRTLNEATLI